MSVTHTVKDTAGRVGLPSRTLRYYDRIGLVSPPRTEAGYRVYGPADEGRLRFVRQAKTLGFSLEEIRALIAAAERGCCSEVLPEVERLLDEKIAAIDVQVDELGAFRERLVAFRARSGSASGGHSAFCGCLDGAPAATASHVGEATACKCGCASSESPPSGKAARR